VNPDLLNNLTGKKLLCLLVYVLLRWNTIVLLQGM